jgi:hypothetical protein
MTADDANEAIAKARHVVDAVERAIAEGLGSEPSSWAESWKLYGSLRGPQGLISQRRLRPDRP